MIDELIRRYPALKTCKKDLEKCLSTMIQCFKSGNKILIAGNGGSAADSDHISAELMKSFYLKRPLPNEFKEKLIAVDKIHGLKISEKLQQPLVALSLPDSSALSSSFSNDIENGDKFLFSQKIYALGKPNDIFLAISTSGKSENIINGAVTAKALGIKVIGLTGGNGGTLKDFCDVCIIVPENKTHLIQELHLPIYHWLCLELEKEFFGE